MFVGIEWKSNGKKKHNGREDSLRPLNPTGLTFKNINPTGVWDGFSSFREIPSLDSTAECRAQTLWESGACFLVLNHPFSLVHMNSPL